MKIISSMRLVPVLLIAVNLCGCMSGIRWQRNFDIQPVNQTEQGYSEVIVSGFLSAEKVVSMTNSLDITTIMESATVYDMSPEIAAALQSRGVKAEARDRIESEDLASDQLLLRGAVIAANPYMERAWFPFFPLGVLSLGVFGMWGPSIVSYDDGFEIQYRVEVIDHEGRYVMSTGTKEARVYVTSRNMLWKSKPEREMFQAMREGIAEELADKIKL